jgi:hypothetical protein
LWFVAYVNCNEMNDLCVRFGVQNYPTTLLLGPDPSSKKNILRTQLATHVGSTDANQLYDFALQFLPGGVRILDQQTFFDLVYFISLSWPIQQL